MGVACALAGVLFVALLGWRLLPVEQRPPTAEEFFAIGDYVTEARVPEGAEVAGRTLRASGSRPVAARCRDLVRVAGRDVADLLKFQIGSLVQTSPGCVRIGRTAEVMQKLRTHPQTMRVAPALGADLSSATTWRPEPALRASSAIARCHAIKSPSTPASTAA